MEKNPAGITEGGVGVNSQRAQQWEEPTATGEVRKEWRTGLTRRLNRRIS